MDFVIVDFDCQSLLTDKTQIKGLLGLQKENEVVFMEEADWEDNQWKIPDNDIKNVDRCVFLTCFTGGIKKYHRDVFANNPQVLSWIIAVLDVEHDSYKKQLLSQVDQAFYASDAYYDVVFDCSDKLQEAGKLCALPAKTHKKCLIISKEQTLAEKVKAVMEGYLSSWEVVSAIITSAEDYRFADAVVVVGDTAEDFDVPAPLVGLNRRYMWLNRSFITPKEYEELMQSVGEIMNNCGWNIADYRKCLYTSDFEYEKLYQKIQNGEIGYSALVEHEAFVMWDAYGLPAVRKDYVPERIADFLKENCCFAKIKERICG